MAINPRAESPGKKKFTETQKWNDSGMFASQRLSVRVVASEGWLTETWRPKVNPGAFSGLCHRGTKQAEKWGSDIDIIDPSTLNFWGEPVPLSPGDLRH